ncbi:hypothetical protein NUU61_005279 [Penicillium alfredii]|uniref:Uncharacterized protein n=1 Tax=Penicillium alfredii TaxID=1506179 RepID=A0A9W9K7F4_9EURO|nr:uncharacterized protein NUU61_005279 [Penicillium alfredii]KAJ5095923.1 hypothetical protein NUU61_005279 [Penicillium alfredii]
MNSPDSGTYDSGSSDERHQSQPKTKIQATFQIARPPPKSHQRLRLTPKLLLQFQQLTPNNRPIPVLEIWQPSFRKSKLTRGFPKRPKLSTGDLYAALNEPYITGNSNSHQTNSARSSSYEKADANSQEKDIVAVICRPAGEDRASAIHFHHARCAWQAIPGNAGSERNIPCYRFVVDNDDDEADESKPSNVEPGRMIMQWEKRTPPDRGDAPRGPLDNDHFVFVMIDRKARRKSRIATMTRGGLDISVRKSSILEHLQACVDSLSPRSTSRSNTDSAASLETWLYIHVLTLGVWVASQEGWLN